MGTQANQPSAGGSSDGKLSAHLRAEIDHWVARFPAGRQRSAVIGALHAAQHENGGYLTRELMEAVAAYLGLPSIQVFEVAAFYSMFETKPVGRHSISVCTNISCMLCGGERLLAHIETRLGIRVGESTPDGCFYLKHEEECLAACTGAPMMMVDHRYYEYLTPAKVDEIIDAIAATDAGDATGFTRAPALDD
jgi:NADH-quinone oxidoreductase subunit E